MRFAAFQTDRVYIIRGHSDHAIKVLQRFSEEDGCNTLIALLAA